MLMNKATVDRCLVLLTCAAAVSISTGCRSMPGMGMFPFRSKPTAEALAGTGPSATYPAPPSDTATPEAIASIAGGTSGSSGPQTAQVAGFDVSPGYATPAANLAAAQANGIHSGTPAAGFDPTAAPQATPSGYKFGSSTFSPKSPSIAPPDSSAYSMASSSASRPSGVTAPSTSFTPPATGGFAPPSMSNYTTPPTAPSTGGFDLPSDPPSLAAGATPSMSFPSSTTPPAATTESTPSVSTTPSFSTASVAPTITAPSTSAPSMPFGGGSSYSGEGYSPGSTGMALEYPIGDVTPTTSGSIFR